MSIHHRITHSPEGENIVVFERNRQAKMEDTREFGMQFRDFKLLLVRRADEAVVAASRDYDYEALLAHFFAKSNEKDEHNYVIQHGPAALEHASKFFSKTDDSAQSRSNSR